MNRSTRRRLLAALPVLALLLPSPATARTWTNLDQQLPASDRPRAALSFVRNHRSTFGLPAGAQLELAGSMAIRGGQVVRLVRRHQGLRLANGELKLLLLGGRIVSAAGDLGGDASSLAAARIDDATAQKRATASIPGSQARSTRAALWRVGRTLRRAWITELSRWRPFGVWRVVTDASSGELLSHSSQLVHISGKAYTTNPKVGQVATVTLEGLSQPTELAGEFADVSSCMVSSNKLQCVRHATPDSTTGDYLYDPQEPSSSDPFAEVQAYYHVDAFHRWLSQTFGFKRPGTKQTIDVFVNYGYENQTGSGQSPYNNAFFGDANGDGRKDLAFGQGHVDYAYDADVIYHEFTHSVVDVTADLQATIDNQGFNLMPMGLNEAFADLFSSIFAGDPVVGDYAGDYGYTEGIRDLRGSSRCPDDLIGESHFDGQIWSRAAWAVREKATDKAAFDDLLYKTLLGLDKAAGIADTAALFVKLAQVSAPAIATLAQAEFSDRGLLTCSRIVPLTESESRRGYVLGRSSVPSLPAVPAGMQYKIEVPEDALTMWINLKPMSFHGGFTFDMGAYIRKGEPVGYVGSKPTYDVVLPSNLNSIQLAVDDPQKRLEPGATYYVLPLNVSADANMYEISTGMTLEQPPEPDAAPVAPDAGVSLSDGAGAGSDGTDDAVDGGSGCSVSGPAAPASALALWPLLLLALLPLGWRRRR